MLLFGVTIPATVPQESEIPEGLMNNPVLVISTEVSLLPLLLTKGCRFAFDEDFTSFVIVSRFPN
jgi:hypothetical protein